MHVTSEGALRFRVRELESAVAEAASRVRRGSDAYAAVASQCPIAQVSSADAEAGVSKRSLAAAVRSRELLTERLRVSTTPPRPSDDITSHHMSQVMEMAAATASAQVCGVRGFGVRCACERHVCVCAEP